MPRWRPTKNTEAVATTKSKDKDIVTISNNWEMIEVDLMKMCPPELFKDLDVPGKKNTKYIPATMVREVIRARGGVEVTNEKMYAPQIGNKNVVLMAEATVCVDGEVFCGTWLDVISIKKFAVASMWQGWHVTSLALKSALKKRFKFFEGDFATAELEDASFDVATLDDLLEEAEEAVKEETVKVEKTTSKKQEPAKVEAPVVAEVEAPVVEEVVAEEPAPVQVATDDGLNDVMLGDEPKASPQPTKKEDPVSMAQALLKEKLEASKSAGDNTLQSMIVIGKHVIEELGIERQSEEHKALIKYADTLREWFTS